MKKVLFMSLFFCSFLIADTLKLKTGWNLIGIPSTDSASILSNNTEIEKASGGGVGNTNAFTYLQAYDYSRGEFILGQAYWIKALSDTSLTYTKVSVPSKISLKTGWNLIYPFKSILASDLANYPEIEKASGGGVGNTNAFTYLKSYNYSRGETLANQGYWIKATADFDMFFVSFDYQAWGIGEVSKTSFRLNGLDYSLLAYSPEDYTVDESLSSPDFTLFIGAIDEKNIDALQISALYNNKDIVLKVFESNTIFDDNTLVYESDSLIANNDTVSFGNISFLNPNDYSVPKPEIISDDLQPPSSPVF